MANAENNLNPFEQALGRYLTQIQLSKIRTVKIGIAGAGGLGSNCAAALVRTGFRNIKIADFDLVDHSNLNRQFYSLNQVGRPKVHSLKENLLAINPAANIEAVQIKLEKANLAEIFVGCDIMVEAFDKPEYKKLIVEVLLPSAKFLVSASGLAGWGGSDRIKTHRIRDNFYMVGDLSTGISPETPPLAPCVLIAAAKQADLVLSYTLGNLEETL